MENPLSEPVLADPGRRGFLKLGVIGGLALGTVGMGAGLAGCHRNEQASAEGYQFFRDGDIALFTALIPAIVANTLTPEPDARRAGVGEILLRMDQACLRLGAPAQKELRQLFDLLNFGLTRRLAAGVAKPWDQVSEDDAAAFLDRWRNSSIGLFNAGYRVLIKLPTVTYFTMPQSWAAVGYPGPLKWMFDAINR